MNKIEIKRLMNVLFEYKDKILDDEIISSILKKTQDISICICEQCKTEYILETETVIKSCQCNLYSLDMYIEKD